MSNQSRVEEIADLLRERMQGQMHQGLEVSTEVSPAGDRIQIDVVVAAEAETRRPWSRQLLLPELDLDDEQVHELADKLALRASRAWLDHEDSSATEGDDDVADA